MKLWASNQNCAMNSQPATTKGISHQILEKRIPVLKCSKSPWPAQEQSLLYTTKHCPIPSSTAGVKVTSTNSTDLYGAPDRELLGSAYQCQVLNEPLADTFASASKLKALVMAWCRSHVLHGHVKVLTCTNSQ